MRRTAHILSLLVVIVISGFLGTLSISAGAAQEEASPIASADVSFPITPASSQCVVEPRPADSFVALLGTPVAAAAPVSEPSSFDVPVGQPAERETRIGVISAIVQFHACFNAGDSLRAFALVTDDFLREYAATNGLTQEDIAMLTAESEPIEPEIRTTILAVTDVTTLDDGRSGAFVVTSSEWRGLDTSYMLFVQQAERWFLDEVIPFLDA